MAQAVDALWPPTRRCRAWWSRATTTCRRPTRPTLGRIEVVEAAHPVPDAAGRARRERIVER
jgi:glycerate 2-kinase